MPDKLVGDKTTLTLVQALMYAAKEHNELISPIFRLIRQANPETARQLSELIDELDQKDKELSMGTFDSMDDLINAPE